MPGKHYFTVTVPPCNGILVNPTSASFTTNGGPGSVTVSMVGSCSWSVTSNVPWITITSGGGPNSGSGAFTYSVSTNKSVDPLTGTLTVAGQFTTNTVTISQDGILLPPLTSIIVDGTADSGYGCPLAVQQLGTGFGDNNSTDLGKANGSELDAAYGLVKDNVLSLLFAGNLQAGGAYGNNRVDIFFMTTPGGPQNTLTNINPSVNSNHTNQLWDSNNGLNNMGATTNGTGPGLTFDPQFEPNYIISVNIGNPYTLYVNYAQLWPGGTNAAGIATNGYFVGYTANTTNANGTLSVGPNGFNPFDIRAAVNNSNTGGVDGHSCASNTVSGVSESTLAASVRTGIELGIPLTALGSPTGSIAICAFITSSDHTYMSNQILGPLGANDPTYCWNSLGVTTNTAAINLGSYPGQHFFYVGPEMRVTRLSVSNGNATVVYQTENNTNLLYRVERASGNYSTNLVWTSLSSFIPGTGGTLTQIDNNVTSKTNVYYRVRQSPNCQ
jgi:hypothetical protein